MIAVSNLCLSVCRFVKGNYNHAKNVHTVFFCPNKKRSHFNFLCSLVCQQMNKWASAALRKQGLIYNGKHDVFCFVCEFARWKIPDLLHLCRRIATKNWILRRKRGGRSDWHIDFLSVWLLLGITFIDAVSIFSCAPNDILDLSFL